MLEIKCTGTPYEIGMTHGVAAKEKIANAISFYAQLFLESCSLTWPQVLQEAAKYVEPLEHTSPRYLEEIKGIAAGSGTAFLDILTLNIRTEIIFGLFSQPGNDSSKAPSDGCTSLAWKAQSGSFLAQTWDWNGGQAPNLVVCHISQPGTGIPDFAMVTEAGIIGKIGLNEKGTGCCLNAIRCSGVDPFKLPIHFALRRVLESSSRAAAVAAIKQAGVAGSGFILIGDATGSTGLECTWKCVREVPVDETNRIYHTNHLIFNVENAEEPPWLDESVARLARVRELGSCVPEPSVEAISGILRGTERYPDPTSSHAGDLATDVETLFTIIMELVGKSARVTFGRQTDIRDKVTISF